MTVSVAEIPNSARKSFSFASSNFPFIGGPYLFIYSTYSIFTPTVITGVSIFANKKPDCWGGGTLFANSSILVCIAFDISNNFVAKLLKNIAELRSNVLSGQQHPSPPAPFAPVDVNFPNKYDGILIYYIGFPYSLYIDYIMPSRTYRRKIRPFSPRYIVPPPIINLINSQFGNGATGGTGTGGTGTAENEFVSELIRIQRYFEFIIDSIIKQSNLTNVITILQDFLNTDSLKTQVEYYNIIDTIEENLISTVMNIAEGTSIGVIKARIDYIRGLIAKLPINPQYHGVLPSIILELVDMIIGGVNLNTITENIKDIQTYINEKYGVLDTMIEIQENVLSIICNIAEGTSSGIIAMRLENLKMLISDLEWKYDIDTNVCAC